MPLDGRTPLQLLLTFGVMVLLSLVLRWIYGRKRDASSVAWPPRSPAFGPDGNQDFGLLAPAAIVDSADEAHHVKQILADAGIKATTARGTDGRHRVLVFASELDRARRVGGWSP